MKDHTRRQKIEDTLVEYGIHLWNPGISEAPNCWVGGAYFVHPGIVNDLVKINKTRRKSK